MSDDTPTQRFPSPGDNPTERINAAVVEDDLQEEKQKSRGLLIGLIIAGALLLAAIIVLVFILGENANGGGNNALPTTPPTTSDPSVTPTDDASATPEPTPSASESDDPGDGDSGDGQSDPPPPPPTGAAFTTFNPKGQVECDKGGPNFTPPPPPIKISWATVRADSAWIVMGTSDAADSQFMQIPLNGNQSDFQYEIDFPCFQGSAKYTITLVGTDGKHVSKTWKVTNVGDKD